MRLRFIAFIISILSFNQLSGQISEGGFPPDFYNSTRQTSGIIELQAPDYELLKRQDDSTGMMGKPERAGILINTDIRILDTGNWVSTSEYGISSWSVNIKVKGATGLAFYFNEFRLASGDKLYLYSEDRRHLIGAFTEKNNKPHSLFSTEIVMGESVIIELVSSEVFSPDRKFRISDVMVSYKPIEFSLLDGSRVLLDADSCEVNIKCEEGANWLDQANGIIRIMVRNNQVAYWCTGSVMNNTAQDFRPLILTADHCAYNDGNDIYSSPTDVAQWIFYFKHESASCTNNAPSGTTRSMTGAVKLASSHSFAYNGSDFYLLELFDNIPNDYQPYFQGWSALPGLSDNGVSIHHPAGDVKKVSTYNTGLEISQWGDTPGTHFLVNWNSTPNGWGVTEGGSSGAPLFNSSKLIIGQLTGGESDCSNTLGSDYFGSFSYSWESNGTHDSLKLEPWLDPLSSGLRVMQGTYNTKVALAQFVADENVIPVNSYVSFNDLSVNSPDSWSWHFQGGTPSQSNTQVPEKILYDKLGTYNVMLVVTNEYGSDTTLLENYIRVVPVVYPNPTRNKINILFGDDPGPHQILIMNTLGKVVSQFEVSGGTHKYEFSFLTKPAGLYIIKVSSPTVEENYKILFSPR